MCREARPRGATAVDPREMTVFLRFADNSKAKFMHGVGWRVFDPWQARGLDSAEYPSVDYFTESLAARWCAHLTIPTTWRERCPDIVGVGICTA